MQKNKVNRGALISLLTRANPCDVSAVFLSSEVDGKVRDFEGLGLIQKRGNYLIISVKLKT